MTPATARPQAGRSGALPGCQGCHSTWMKCACPAQHFHFKHCSLAVRCRARARSLAGTLQACTLQPGSSRPVTQRDSGRDTRGAPCRPWTGRPGRRRRQGTCASRGRARRCAAPPRPPARRPSARPRRDVAALVCTQSLSLPCLALPSLALPCLSFLSFPFSFPVVVTYPLFKVTLHNCTMLTTNATTSCCAATR
jgi:hypothetical protein